VLYIWGRVKVDDGERARAGGVSSGGLSLYTMGKDGGERHGAKRMATNSKLHQAFAFTYFVA
jgi:hypothetical protein